MEVVDLRHFLVDGEAVSDVVPEAVARRARRLGEIVRHATMNRSGVTLQVPVACHKRPGRRPCRGFLVVYRQDAPAHIRWECPVCRNGGSISGWEGTVFDLRALDVEDFDSADRVELPLELHVVLPALAARSRECSAVVYPALVVGDRIVLPVPPELRAEIAAHALRAAIESSGAKTAARLLHVATAIGGELAARSPFVDFGEVTVEALAGLMADLDLLAKAAPPAPRRKRRGSTARRCADRRTFVLKISVRGLEPPAWRRLEVPADIELPDLHDALQIAMGWTDSHLHAFRFGKKMFSPRHDDWEAIGEDTDRVRLSDVLPRGRGSFVYEYDFGDSWEHDVVVEAIHDQECRRLRCVAGAGACPPEDCGGIPGYARLLEALADPEHEEHAFLAEWVGGRFDPGAFDLRATDKELGRIRVRRT